MHMRLSDMQERREGEDRDAYEIDKIKKKFLK